VNGENHAELQELLGAFALDAVDPDERVRVEAHVAHCEGCRAEVAMHHRALACLTPDEPASLGAWSAIGEQTRGRRAGLRRSVVAAAAVVLLVGGLVIGLAVLGSDERDDDLAAVAEASFDDPAATELTLVDDDGAHRARVAVLPDGAGFVALDDLPVLQGDRTYQLWQITGEDEPVSLGLLGPGEGYAAFHVGAPRGTLAISEEPEGGVPAPTGAVVATGEL
jgi:anti-sigma-K factor RskA